MSKNKVCGTCVWYVDGKCWFNHSFGEITDHATTDSCRSWDTSREEFFCIKKADVQAIADNFKSLREKYGHNVCCKECIWYCSDTEEHKGICARTRFDLEVLSNAYACSHFEPDHEDNGGAP